MGIWENYSILKGSGQRKLAFEANISCRMIQLHKKTAPLSWSRFS